MTPALEQIKALPAKWRDAASKWDNLHSGAEAAFRLRDCADELDTALQALRDGAMEAGLPCDVIVAPATRIRAGCKLSTLLHCIDTRRNAPPLPDPDPEAFAALLRDLRRPAPAAEARPCREAMTPFDRCEFALRDAGYDYDEAFRVAQAAYGPAATPPSAPAEHEGDPQSCREADGCPTEGAVLRREWRAMKARIAALEAALAATPPSAPAVEAIPQAAVWLEQNGQDATMEWQAGWDACRVEYPSRRLSAPAPQEGVDWQKRCLEHGFKYWRAPDAHGVECTHEQALDLLRDLLGVEVDFVEPAALAAGALPQDRQAKWKQAATLLRELGQRGMAESAAGFAIVERLAAEQRESLAAAPAQGVR